ncbi:DUF1858 domain-containing protein [Parasedimentitalea psychrophila]|uniref:DUF1858 domain-containing protein n=1 Tax=Parasedimentitalea psychrophila TaxID=2997337 RepID=A0A9Y2KZN0_9RHOB|nr:DUF1858 domain-containing protein [Parasedimentitalea psychrophila]WIY24124.1 DUF1858 domain-containing protein [Parasedimentitalea psychrophila]
MIQNKVAGVFGAIVKYTAGCLRRTRDQDRMVLIDKTLLVSEILARYPQTVPVFLKYQMLCVGCLVAPFHSIEDACLEHDLDEDAFRADLTTAIAQATQTDKSA